MNTQQDKLKRILNVRMKFMNKQWDGVEVEILKTLLRIKFYSDESNGNKEYQLFRSTEYSLTPTFTIEQVIEDQQRKLGRDVISYVGKENMDELQEVLVG